MLNARRHRVGDQLQRFKLHVVVVGVLNARRHRDGDQARSSPRASQWAAVCSTPEGIETVISWRSHGYRDHADLCSTPEGIETVIRHDRRRDP